MQISCCSLQKSQKKHNIFLAFKEFYRTCILLTSLFTNSRFGVAITMGFPGGSDGKESTWNSGDCQQCRRPGLNPWVGKIAWRRKWQPTPVFFPGKSHEQRSLADYSPWGRKESDMTERLHFTRLFAIQTFLQWKTEQLLTLHTIYAEMWERLMENFPPAHLSTLFKD